MRASRTYGSMRGACDETLVPTATIAISFEFLGKASPHWQAREPIGALRRRFSDRLRTPILASGSLSAAAHAFLFAQSLLVL
jgi:hypothetical protein